MSSSIPRARRRAGIAVLCAALAPLAFAQTAPPAVTTGADIKLLKFRWNYVPKANWYELWFKANPGAAWTKYAETPSSRPRVDIGVSAHLLDWQQARYQVKACNPSGCGASTPISVGNRFFDAVGYFKAAVPVSGARLGDSTALSEDGRTLIALSTREPYVGPEQPGRTAVFVFAKSGDTWRQQARLIPNPSLVDAGETPVITVSGDGNVVALGLLGDGPTGNTSTSSTGSVYVFRRTGTTWKQEARIRHRTDVDAFFGFDVRLDEAGRKLLVLSANQRGTGNIFEYANGAWTRTGEVPGVGAAANCEAATLSGDGLTVARICRVGPGQRAQLQFFSAPAWTLSDTIVLTPTRADNDYLRLAVSYDAKVVIAAEEGIRVEEEDGGYWAGPSYPAVHVYDRPRNYHDTLVPRWACLDPPTQFNADRSAYGNRIAISRDGGFIAISDPSDECTELGSVQYATNKGMFRTSAVYVYGKTASGNWPLRRTLKANVAESARRFVPGALSFGLNGKSLAVSQPIDDSGSGGINGNRRDTSQPGSGAVWLY